MVSKAAPKIHVPHDIAARTLAGLLRDIVASGLKPIESPDVSDADAVHDLRKALKGWRAMLRLIKPTVGDEAELIRVRARDLAREIAAARDYQAAQEALADLGNGIAKLQAKSRAAISERLDALRADAEAVSLTPDRKARIRQMWADAGAAIERWPIERFDRKEAARQLTASYRRVRAACPEDWAEASPDALHKLRQRVIDHRYQMEIAEPVWPKVIRLVVSEAQRLRDRLGAHHDLAILRHLTGSDQPLAHWRPQLAPLIAARQTAHAMAAKRLAGRLFVEKPKAFLERLTLLWEHCAEEDHGLAD
jgi:CHAD domain-containing protein